LTSGTTVITLKGMVGVVGLQNEWNAECDWQRAWYADLVKAQQINANIPPEARERATEKQLRLRKRGGATTRDHKVLKSGRWPEEREWLAKWEAARTYDEKWMVLRQLRLQRQRVERNDLGDHTPSQKHYWLLESGQFEGVSDRDAALRLDLEVQTVESLRAGTKTPEQAERVRRTRELRAEGKTYAEIAAEFGVSTTTVYRWDKGSLQGKRERKLPARAA
jgi:hypothetical protein